MDEDLISLRRRDFYTALLIIAVAVFFLTRTAALPFFRASAAGVDGAEWYNSAALVPYLVFGALLACGLGLLAVALRDGGAPGWLSRRAIAAKTAAAPGRDRIAAVAVIVLLYIFALVPRVDFILASALVLLALVVGFHQTRPRPLLLALAAVAVPAVYALVVHYPQAEWQSAHDDDWLTLAAFLALLTACWAEARAETGRIGPVLRWAPALALALPAFLICAMAFGFRQNVPNRGGLVFSQIQYHYFVTLRPLWQGER